MNALAAQLPALQVVVPLLGAVLAAFLRRGPAAFVLALVTSWITAAIAAALLWLALSAGPISYHLGGWEPPWGIEYRVDILSGFVLMLVSGAGAVMMPFAGRSVALEIGDRRQAWFYCMYLLCLTGLLGIAITGDAFNAFVFLEVSSLSMYVLIALGPDRRALLAAYQYLIMGTIGATFYVIGVAFLYLLTGSLNMVDIAAQLPAAFAERPRPGIAALGFLTVGIGLKLALFPLHVWLPNAYSYAPSMASSFLAATATKVAIYLLIRFFFSVFGFAGNFPSLPLQELLLILSVAAIFVASTVAVFQDDVRRMFAYSSIAQVGYITLGVSLANQPGLTGGIVHIFNHAIMKGAVFLALGAVFFKVRTVRLADLAGLGRKMPLTMTAFAVAGFGIIGTPGTAGFVSKWYLALGAVERGWWWLVFLIIVSAVLSFVYVARVVETVWFRPPTQVSANAADPPLSMLLPALLLAAMTIYFGLDTTLSVDIAAKAASALLGTAQ